MLTAWRTTGKRCVTVPVERAPDLRRDPVVAVGLGACLELPGDRCYRGSLLVGVVLAGSGVVRYRVADPVVTIRDVGCGLVDTRCRTVAVVVLRETERVSLPLAKLD